MSDHDLEVKFLAQAADVLPRPRAQQLRAQRQRARLDRIEQRLDRLRIPAAFTAEFYNLRSHIQLVRNQLREPPAAP